MTIRLPNLIFSWVVILLFPGIFSFDLSENENNIIRNISSKKSERILERAQQAIKSDKYFEAEELVLKAVYIDSTNIKAYLLLSDISDELKKKEQQKQALSKVISLDSINYPLASKLLADLCFNNGDYRDALVVYHRYSRYQLVKDSSLIRNKINSCNFALASLLQNSHVLITHLNSNVNTPLQEYWPAISTNDSLLYFTRLIENENRFPYERIFISEKNDSTWGKAFEMNISDNEDVNLGTMCMSSDGKLLFFTACGSNDGKGSCDIFYSRKQNNRWSKPINAGKNINSSFWEAQPSVSSDNRKLFFSSNRPGVGGMDIWCSEIIDTTNGNLIFKTPINIGKAVNSVGNDFSPFIHADGSTLYFSSEGKYGMGGSDLFISKLTDTVWSEAINLGYPINTRFNEDGLVVSPTSNVAMFSSNREGAIDGSKDLYQLKLPTEYLPEKVGYIRGFVYDIETGLKLQATIEITQLESNELKRIVSDSSEGFITTLVSKKRYALNVEKEGYLFYSRNFDLTGNSEFYNSEHIDIYLEPIKKGKKFVLSNIFFDFDSDRLKEESNAELNQLTAFLKNNSRLKIEISGHTDNVGNDEYNLELSENRANAIFDYLKQFIDPNRMTYKGYGSELPVSSNDSEQGRSQNRRCEIEIVSF